MASYLVMLATGQQGRATVKYLLSSGASVHAVVRDPSSSAALALSNPSDGKVTLFKGGLTDLSAYRAAAKGCVGIFVNLPDMDPNEVDADAHYRIVADILRVCREEGVKNVVASTAMLTGAREKWDNEISARIGMRGFMLSKNAVEEATRSAGMTNWTILRPGWLMGNYLSRAVYQELSTTGELVHSLHKGRTLQHVDEEDVGRYAAAALRDPERFHGREIELANESLTMEDVVKIMEKVCGRDVRARERTEEEEQVAWKGAHLPAALPFELWANEFEFLADEVPTKEEYGLVLTALNGYLQREKERLLEALPSR